MISEEGEDIVVKEEPSEVSNNIYVNWNFIGVLNFWIAVSLAAELLFIWFTRDYSASVMSYAYFKVTTTEFKSNIFTQV